MDHTRLLLGSAPSGEEERTEKVRVAELAALLGQSAVGDGALCLCLCGLKGGR